MLVRTEWRRHQDHLVWRSLHLCSTNVSFAAARLQRQNVTAHTGTPNPIDPQAPSDAYWSMSTGTLLDTHPALSRTLMGACIDTQSQRMHQSQPMRCEQPEWQLVQQGMRKCQPANTVVLLLQINYGTRTLEKVYQLHSAAINCMLVSEGLCVTGSDDKFLRVWPLDFSDFLLEVAPCLHVSPPMCV